MSTKRCKITITIQPEMKEYTDEITESVLIEYINNFINRVKFHKKTDVTFQCSYDLTKFDNSYGKLNTIFEQEVAGVIFTYTINGFSQFSKCNADFAHTTVLKTLSTLKSKHYLGVGGESLLYGVGNSIAGVNKFTDIAVHTNRNTIHADNLRNVLRLYDKPTLEDTTLKYETKLGIPRCYLSDYDELDVTVYKEPCVCVTNISRKGIGKHLCAKIDQLYIRDIIGVYCTEKYNDDAKYLSNYYIEKIESNGYLTTVHFKRIPIVSLGNTCAVAYQLQDCKLREARYPFDWLRYKSADQLIKCLEEKFADFTKIVASKPPSGLFPIIDEDFPTDDMILSKEILENTYGMMFPHDRRDELERYTTRIERMFRLTAIDYIINLTLNGDQINRIIELLPNLRRLIVVMDSKCVTKEPSSNKVVLVDAEKYKIEEETTKKGVTEKNETNKKESVKKKKPSWKKENLDWLKIFEMVRS
jgi:hypothetical protein